MKPTSCVQCSRADCELLLLGLAGAEALAVAVEELAGEVPAS